MRAYSKRAIPPARGAANAQILCRTGLLVAWFLTNVPVRGRPLIWDTDKVVIPDGSSAFYVGVGVAAWRKCVCVIGSNGPLSCEYLTNPAFSDALDHFYLIGGKADRCEPRAERAGAFKRSENGGTFDLPAHKAYEEAILADPAATVVVMPVSGILPEEGPYGLEDQTRRLKEVIIKSGLRHGIRQLVFIADYTKHRRADKNKYGLPVLNTPAEWDALLQDHHARISLVTVPPPDMRELFQGAQPIHPAERMTTRMLRADAQPIREWNDYNEIACAFGELFQDDMGRSNFHEVYSLSDKCKNPRLWCQKLPHQPRYTKRRGRAAVATQEEIDGQGQAALTL